MNESRVPSGIAGLDVLLNGGFLAGGVYLIMGRPGTGKTTLANQFCFSHVRRGRRATYLTLLAETHGRMLRNLQGMSFFEPQAVGSAITYVGAYLVLREKGLTGLLQLIRKLLADERPSLLVIDGVSSLPSGREQQPALKEFIAELQVLCDMASCTTLMLANMGADEAQAPEHSMVDGLLELTLHRNGQRTFREIDVLKFRGTQHLLGRHDLEIDEDGIHVRPRLELLLANRSRQAPRNGNRRVNTGVDNLDAMLGGGVLSGSSTMLLGFAGSGKTLLGLHFLDAGARLGEHGVYFGFYESPSRLVESAERVGLKFEDHVERGLLDIEWQPSLKYGLDELGERLLDRIVKRDAKRVVIDGLDGFRQSAYFPERTIRFITALFNELRAMDVTLVLTEETQKIFGPEVEVRIEGLSALVDNIVLLEYLDHGADLKRLLSIVKQRGSGYETYIRELCITPQGLSLAEDGNSAADILEATWKAFRGRSPRSTPAGRRDSRGPGK